MTSGLVTTTGTTQQQRQQGHRVMIMQCTLLALTLLLLGAVPATSAAAAAAAAAGVAPQAHGVQFPAPPRGFSEIRSWRDALDWMLGAGRVSRVDGFCVVSVRELAPPGDALGMNRWRCNAWQEQQGPSEPTDVECLDSSRNGRYCSAWMSAEAVSAPRLECLGADGRWRPESGGGGTFRRSRRLSGGSGRPVEEAGLAGCRVVMHVTTEVKSCECQLEAVNGNFCRSWVCERFNSNDPRGSPRMQYNCTASFDSSLAAAPQEEQGAGKLPQDVLDEVSPSHTFCSGWYGRNEGRTFTEERWCSCRKAGINGDLCQEWDCQDRLQSWALLFWPHLLAASYVVAYGLIAAMAALADYLARDESDAQRGGCHEPLLLEGTDAADADVDADAYVHADEEGCGNGLQQRLRLAGLCFVFMNWMLTSTSLATFLLEQLVQALLGEGSQAGIGLYAADAVAAAAALAVLAVFILPRLFELHEADLLKALGPGTSVGVCWVLFHAMLPLMPGSGATAALLLGLVFGLGVGVDFGLTIKDVLLGDEASDEKVRASEPASEAPGKPAPASALPDQTPPPMKAPTPANAQAISPPASAASLIPPPLPPLPL